jgi:hypothetical protein
MVVDSQSTGIASILSRRRVEVAIIIDLFVFILIVIVIVFTKIFTSLS